VDYGWNLSRRFIGRARFKGLPEKTRGGGGEDARILSRVPPRWKTGNRLRAPSAQKARKSAAGGGSQIPLFARSSGGRAGWMGERRRGGLNVSTVPGARSSPSTDGGATLLVAAERITKGALCRAEGRVPRESLEHRPLRSLRLAWSEPKGEPRERGCCITQLGVTKFLWTAGGRESARLCLPDEIYVIIRGRDSCAGMLGN